MSTSIYPKSQCNALGGINLSELFAPVVKGEYANKEIVFAPPVNREEAMLKAIELLRAKLPEPVDGKEIDCLKHAW